MGLDSPDCSLFCKPVIILRSTYSRLGAKNLYLAHWIGRLSPNRSSSLDSVNSAAFSGLRFQDVACEEIGSE